MFLFQIIKEGTELRPQRGDICQINLEGTLKDGTVVEKKENFGIQLGDGDVRITILYNR